MSDDDEAGSSPSPVLRALWSFDGESGERSSVDDRRPGHLALVSEDRGQHTQTAFRFLRHGLEREDERVLYVAGERSRATVLETMRDHDIDVDRRLDSDALSVCTSTASESADPTPEFVLDHVERAVEELPADREALRLVTEASRLFDGGDAVADYERRLSDICQGEPVLALCGYLRGRTQPVLIRDVIRGHPYVVSDGTLSRNRYYTPPADLWEGDPTEGTVDRMLETLRSAPALPSRATVPFSPDRKRLERELRTEREHFRVALENSPFTAFRLDTDLRYTWIGNPHADFDVDAVLGKRDDELLPPGPAEKVMAPKREVLATGEGVREEITYELPSGTVTYDLTVEPLRDDSGAVVGLTAAAMDLTDRKRLQHLLSGLHEASRALVRARSKDEASQRTVDAAVDALGVDSVGLYLFDDADNRLRPTAASASFSEHCGPLSAVGPPSDSPAWRAFITDETVHRDDLADTDEGQRGESSTQSGLWIPLGDHGVLAIRAPDGDGFDGQILEAADHLAATAEATLDRIEHRESIRNRERNLAEKNRRLERLREVTDIIREIDQALIGATTTEAIATAVCERLARTDRFRFAWLGQRTGETVTARTRAGRGGAYLDDVSFETDAEFGEPAARTAVSGTVTHVDNVADGLRGEPWRRRALARDFQSVLSVPVQYRGVQFGVLTIYAAEPGAFDSLTREVLTELGDTVGNAMGAVETRQALHSDSAVELRLTVRDPGDPLARLATATGCDIRVRGAVPMSDDRVRVFVTVSDAPVSEFEAATAATEDVEQFSQLGDGDARRFELVVSGRTMSTTLATLGAAVRSIEVRDGEAVVVVELPQSTSVRTFVDRLEATYSDVSLHARRDTRRTESMGEDDPTALTEEMTDRQLEVLQTAYLSGYFEWPRERTGEEVAASLGITQSTFNNHLRTAERKLLSRLFDGSLSSR